MRAKLTPGNPVDLPNVTRARPRPFDLRIYVRATETQLCREHDRPAKTEVMGG